MWHQQQIILEPFSRGIHLITDQIVNSVGALSGMEVGLLHLFLQHTSASLTINENAAPEVRIDLEYALNKLVPESSSFLHSDEGPDDMPAHVKSSLLGASLSIPISQGRMALGTWQGIYLWEHRNQAGSRRILATTSGK